MGTWIGHIAPGVFFVMFAFWWHINNCSRYIRSLANADEEKSERKRIQFQGSTTYPCFWIPFKACRRLPIESIVKILITTIHFTIEIITGYNRKPRPYLGTVNAHHTAMLFGFFLGSWIEILVHYKVPLPKRTTQVMGLIAFAMEALMMIFHLHARSMIDTHIHQLLALTMTGSMIGAIGECFDPDNFWFVVVRSFFALTQGTWFIQAAYVIWPSSTNPNFIWKPNSHRSVSLLTMCYSYHLAGNAFILIILYLIMHACVSSSSAKKTTYHSEVDEEPTDQYKLILDTNDEDTAL